jgi:hypothetical protein
MAQTSKSESTRHWLDRVQDYELGILNKRKDRVIFGFQRWRWWLDGWTDRPIAICFWETTVLHRKG